MNGQLHRGAPPHDAKPGPNGPSATAGRPPSPERPLDRDRLRRRRPFRPASPSRAARITSIATGF